ncbi:MAG: DUF3619 family protein [Comamonadaceae bacterium]|nr:DUF3619 family protein [Pseudomonadota bacterium]MBS0610189.1 DUF3619 family protein [Pseudomonadota bacterium]MDE2415835.1 DUF3619 family protein [Comamonadaceae bacterium]
MNRTTEPTMQASQAADAYARRLAARLTHGNADLPYDITERLRAARMQALAQRKRPLLLPERKTATATQVIANGSTAALGGWGREGGNWWRALVSAVPLTALVIGLFFVDTAQDNATATEIAEVDSALLTDDLPPSAYADPGFAQFLKSTNPNR